MTQIFLYKNLYPLPVELNLFQKCRYFRKYKRIDFINILFFFAKVTLKANISLSRWICFRLDKFSKRIGMHNTGSVLTSQLLAKRKSKICGEKSREFVIVFCRHGSCTWLHKLSSTTLHRVSIFYLDVSYQSRFPIYLNVMKQ